MEELTAANKISCCWDRTPLLSPLHLGGAAAAAASFFLSMTSLSKSALPSRSHINAMCCARASKQRHATTKHMGKHHMSTCRKTKRNGSGGGSCSDGLRAAADVYVCGCCGADDKCGWRCSCCRPRAPSAGAAHRPASLRPPRAAQCCWPCPSSRALSVASR